MHTQFPEDATKRHYTYRNRGYLMAQPGMRKLLPQEWARFTWYFLISRRSLAGFDEWRRLRKLGRKERFQRSPDLAV
jgi:rhamnopyranosyl-N-acetylglucosaminyl-diphospho-decaprenol beta-1,3/1,4-galactofuranosyltransferase